MYTILIHLIDQYTLSIILQRGSNGTEKSNIRNLMNIHRYLARINKVLETFLANIPTLSLSTLTNPILRMCRQLKKELDEYSPTILNFHLLEKLLCK